MKMITWISANDWIEAQTEAQKREFASSRPTPRAKRMGLRKEPSEREQRRREIQDKLWKMGY